jgi:hypothetical protein
MKRKTLLMATILGVVLVVTNVTGSLGASDTHLQFQNQSVTRNRPGIAEQCVYFDPKSAHIGHFMDRSTLELVVAPLRTLSRFDNRNDAVRSLRIMQHYGINELCVAANSKLSYMLVSGKAPIGKVAGEKYVTFDLYQLKAARVANEWKLVSGTAALFSFGSDESAARQALQVIRYYGFNAICSIGGGDKRFIFLCALSKPPGIEKKPFLEAKARPGP